MKRKVVSGIMLTLLLVSMLTLTHTLTIANASPETILYIDPPSIVDPTQTPGSTFTVDVMVSDVAAEYGCFAWQVNMSFDPNILELVNVTEGDFLKDQPEGTMGLYFAEENWALFTWTTIGPYHGVNGSGTLATVEFLVIGIGESIINIDHPLTLLWEMLPPPLPSGEDPVREIPCVKENGYFSNSGAVIVPASIDIEPDTLNLKSKGRWIKAYIELLEEYNVSDVDISTVRLNGEIPAKSHPTEIGDHDKDGIPDLMVKFNRQDLTALLSIGEVTLTITGEVAGTPFEGTGTISVIGN